MTETFACPECGDEVTLLGATPGREVQCARCSTWIEVPYFPRTGVWTRPRFQAKNRWIIPLAWSGVGLLAVLIAVFAGLKYADSRHRAAEDAALNEFIKAADTAEKSGRPARALSEIEAALAYLKKSGSVETDSDKYLDVQSRRDRLSVREAEARIEASAKLAPKSAVGDLIALQKRARTDRALDGLVSVIGEAIDAARRREISADLDACRKAAQENRPLDAIPLAESALAVADKLDQPTFRATMADAESILTPILGRHGLILTQSPGQFTLGSPESYAQKARPHLIDALRKQGYAPRPNQGPATVLWDRFAGQHLEFQVNEALGSLYLQSQNRVSDLGVRLIFRRGQTIVWQTKITTRTQVPLPDLAAFVASRLAVSDKRSPDVERMLYDDAFATFLGQIPQAVKGVPVP